MLFLINDFHRINDIYGVTKVFKKVQTEQWAKILISKTFRDILIGKSGA